MTEEQHYEDIDISDIMEESEPYFQDQAETDFQNTEISEDLSVNTIQNSETPHSEEHTEEKKQNKSETVRCTRLPMARIKNIMKFDPDVSIVSSDAVFLVTKATELFLETIAKETYAYTSSNKRKVISKKDLDLIISKVDCLCFLEGAMDF